MQGLVGEVSERVKREGGPRIRREGMKFERTSTRLCLFLPFPACRRQKRREKVDDDGDDDDNNNGGRSIKEKKNGGVQTD